MKIKIAVEKNDYRGDGKSWVAKSDENGNIVEFIRCDEFHGNSNRSGYAYQGEKIYYLDDGYYIVNEPYTKTYSIRALFKIENGKLHLIWSKYANGYNKGEKAPAPRCIAFHPQYVKQG